MRGDRVVQMDRRARKMLDADAVRRKFGVVPALIPDYLALVGDAADGYPGIPGIGAVTAARLLNRYGAIETFPPEVLGDRRDEALLFKKLATLRTDAPLFRNVDALRWRGPAEPVRLVDERRWRRLGCSTGAARHKGSSSRPRPRAAGCTLLSYPARARPAECDHSDLARTTAASVAARTPALAKLTRPKLYDALPRPRLFALLDDAATRPIVWVCAPPGAGKSTLVASWLEARKRRHLWYQVDVGDADPATFVHYMRIAAQQVAGKAAASLPLYTSELQQNLARFARGFFRDLFSVLPHPCAVVFDNFHEARTPSEQRAALAQGLEEIPEGDHARRHVEDRAAARVRAAGRESPDRAHRRGGAALHARGDRGDPRRPAISRRSDLERIQRQSDGWVAALVLLREHLSRHGAALDASLAEGKDTIFQYFAGEIFNSAQPENQRALMLTAIPPSFTQADAVALTGRDDVARLLEYLYRRHLFTDRRRGAQTTYHYHALFREFLLEEMRNRLSADEQRAASKRAAELLAERGQVSDALALFHEAGEWEAMHALIRANALDWARQGRAQAVSDWIEALPPAHARKRSVARVLVRPRVDLHRSRSAGGRRSSARTRRSRPPAICAARRSRSARSSPATTTSGRTSRRSTGGCPSSSGCSRADARRSSIARASCARRRPS